MHKTISVAVLISTYNWPRALEPVLLSISKQTYMPDEIIIADDGSGSDTKDLNEYYKSEFNLPGLLHSGLKREILKNKEIRNKDGYQEA